MEKHYLFIVKNLFFFQCEQGQPPPTDALTLVVRFKGQGSSPSVAWDQMGVVTSDELMTTKPFPSALKVNPFCGM